LKTTYGGYARWVAPAEQSIADEIVIDSPFQTPDAYLNPKSPITRTISSAMLCSAGATQRA
jgi:hypothetical protein